MRRFRVVSGLIGAALGLSPQSLRAEVTGSDPPIFVRVGPVRVPPGGGPVIVITWRGRPFRQSISFTWVDGEDGRIQKWCGFTGWGGPVGDTPLPKTLCEGDVISPSGPGVSMNGYMSVLRLPANPVGTMFSVYGAASVEVSKSAKAVSVPLSGLPGMLCDHAPAVIRNHRSKRLVGTRWVEAGRAELTNCARARSGFYQVRDRSNQVITYLYVPSRADHKELCQVDAAYPRCPPAS